MPGFIDLLGKLENITAATAFGFTVQDDNNKCFYLREMFVAEGYQMKGIGSSLLIHLNSYLQRSGYGEIYLVTLKDSSAGKFYRKHGFTMDRRYEILGKSFQKE